MHFILPPDLIHETQPNRTKKATVRIIPTVYGSIYNAQVCQGPCGFSLIHQDDNKQRKINLDRHVTSLVLSFRPFSPFFFCLLHLLVCIKVEDDADETSGAQQNVYHARTAGRHLTPIYVFSAKNTLELIYSPNKNRSETASDGKSHTCQQSPTVIKPASAECSIHILIAID